MLLGTRHMLARHSNLHFKINDIDINNVESVKYLGVYIDRELKWNIQIVLKNRQDDRFSWKVKIFCN